MAAQLHFGTGDSVGFGTSGSATATTATFNRSSLANMQIGDLLVVYVQNQSGATGQTITPPTGWIAYGPAPGSPNWPASRLSSFYYYPIKSQADLDAISSSVTWTFSITGSRVACVVARATGIDLDNIEDAEATVVTAGVANASSVSIAGITTVNATTLLVGAAYHQSSASTNSPTTTSFMTGFQEFKTAPTGSALANSGTTLGYNYLTSAGATGAVVATFDLGATASGGALVAFKAGPWTPPAPVGKAIKYTSAPDTLADGQLFYTSATDTLAVPAEVRPFPTGYASISAMLAQNPFYAAHRAGDTDWPEMSLYGYTQSGFWGAGALEITLARTSDGVWFGLHDDTLDRTSGTVGFTASAHTWAEVQAYQIDSSLTNDPSQPNQPYMRLEELFDAYYQSHIIFIDAKDALAFSSELLDMMDALPGTPTNTLIAKYYGPSPAWAISARARGYKTWGFFYEVNLSVFSTYQGYYDILGMEYGAAQSTWNAILAFGKPVIGHIITSNTDATAALSKGAVGLMVSGVKEVIPRST